MDRGRCAFIHQQGDKMVVRLARRDWVFGEDPGMNCFFVAGADGAFLHIADVTGATLDVYDMTTNPSAPLTSFNIFASDRFKVFDTLQNDAYWGNNGGNNDIGYNVRHYVRASDFAGATALIAGHSYRFVYTFTSPEFTNVTTRSFGSLMQMREGTCLEKMAA